jgi:hypothetical protein
MEDLDKLLKEFEGQLADLQKDGSLATEAPRVFREFAAEVDRRTGQDRRARPRAAPDRRQNKA